MQSSEEWISLNQFMKRFKVGYDVALQMIEDKEVICRKTAGGRYKIKINAETVSNDRYESVVRENAELKATIRNLKTILTEIRV